MVPAGWRYTLGSWLALPYDAPSIELAGSHLIAREVAFMHTHEFAFRFFDKTHAICCVDVSTRPGGEVVHGGLLIYPPFDDRGDDLLQGGAMTEPERVRLAERLPQRSVPRGRTLISPHEHILQQVEAVEFVHTKCAEGIGRIRHANERGARFLRIRGIFAARRDTRLFTSMNG